MDNRTKFILEEKDIPPAWYNIQADLPAPCRPYATRRPKT